MKQERCSCKNLRGGRAGKCVAQVENHNNALRGNYIIEREVCHA